MSKAELRTGHNGREFVEAEITVSRHQGAEYHIKPSMGYLGIMTGTVKVTGFKDAKAINSELAEQYMQGWEDNDENYLEQFVMIFEEPWVVYEYAEGGEQGQLEMPFRLFVDHTTSKY